MMKMRAQLTPSNVNSNFELAALRFVRKLVEYGLARFAWKRKLCYLMKHRRMNRQLKSRWSFLASARDQLGMFIRNVLKCGSEDSNKEANQKEPTVKSVNHKFSSKKSRFDIVIVTWITSVKPLLVMQFVWLPRLSWLQSLG